MEEYVVELIKDTGYAGILIAVLIYIFKFLKNEVKDFRDSLEEYTETVDKLLQNNNSLVAQYLNTVASLKQIHNALLIAFDGSNVDSYKQAARILKEDKDAREDKLE